MYFQIYYLHHLHSVYTLFNSEAFDTWSTVSAMIGRHLFDNIQKFPKRRYSCMRIAALFLNHWFHAVLSAFWAPLTRMIGPQIDFIIFSDQIMNMIKIMNKAASHIKNPRTVN